ncbi:MAG: 4-hydroxythreonine-4-phosphate dehydrogenase PdxA [bacterium]|nr:4-hydroxythreonine-4-phosphate dehydrogenase PdxA [bacterium]
MTTSILITPGDACGIGPEVALKAARFFGTKRVVCVGPPWLWRAAARKFGISELPPTLPVSALSNIPPQRFEFGRVSPLWGRIAVECVRAAARACMTGEAAALVTAPLTKAAMHAAGYHYQGHTDLLADLTGCSRYAMMLSAGRLRVIFVTMHQALRTVPDSLTSEAIRTTIELADTACRQLGIPHPRIAVCALNPHAGEAGAFGSEEEKVIVPAIKAAKIGSVSGPYSADTIFLRARRGEFDIVVAMYHDQGAIPIKLVGFANGVNTTVGLPIIRTSPDHGSAYDIAGRGVADFRSMLAALRMAARLVRRRSAL